MIIIGHRGAAGLAPENTLKSFRTALSAKVPVIEFDIRKTKDGKMVVIHDNKIDRTSNGRGKVSNLQCHKLKQFDFGEGEKIPTLEEVLKLLKDKTKINIEIKAKNLEIDLLKLINEYQLEKEVIISSFSHSYLKKIRQLNKKIKLGLASYWLKQRQIKIAKKLKISWLIVDCQRLNEKNIALAHQNNLKVYGWTINDQEVFKKMKKIGVDGIFTDYPDRFL